MKRTFLIACCLAGIAPGYAATGAHLLKDLNSGPAGSYPSNFTVFGGQLYFTAYTFDTGVELWKYDGTTVTLAADINDTKTDVGVGVPQGNDSVPDWLTEFAGQLYFGAFNPRRGAELWRFDGIQATRVSDINPDQNDTIKPVSNSSWPRELTVLNDTLFFAATSSTTPENYELWSYNLSSGVRRASNLHPDTGTNYSSFPTGLTVFNGLLYFMADDGTHGWELAKYNGTDAVILDLNPGGAASSSYPRNFIPFDNNLFFMAYRADTGFELWRTDGAGATLASDIFPGAESSNPGLPTVYNGALYFSANDGTHGYELQKYANGQTTLAADINPGADSYPKNLTVLGNLLMFAATDGVHGWELWKYDGATASMVTDLNTSGDSFPEELTVLDGVLYFTATTPETGYEIFKFDGSGVSLAAEINPGSGDSFPKFLSVVNDRLYFRAADDGASNWEPWVLDSAPPANQPPSATLAAPAAGATFSTTDRINFEATATDDLAVSRVEFYANDVLIGTDTQAPYTASANLAAGTYSISARAFDAAGLTGTSAPISITVQTPVSNPPPSFTAISRNGDVITLTLSGVDGVSYQLQGTDDLQNWTIADTRTATGGVVTFTDNATLSKRFYRVIAL